MRKFKRVLSIFLIVTVTLAAILSDKSIANASLLPIQEVTAYLTLNDLQPGFDLAAVPIEDILSNLKDREGNPVEVNENADTVWNYVTGPDGELLQDEYHIIRHGETIDLTWLQDEYYYSYFEMEIIVGSGNQLDYNNIRYIVTVDLASKKLKNFIAYELYSQDKDGNRSKVEPKEVISYSADSTQYYIVPDYDESIEYYLGINLLQEFESGIEVNFYLRKWDSVSGKYIKTEENITTQILNQDMEQVNAGYSLGTGFQRAGLDFFVELTDIANKKALYSSRHYFRAIADMRDHSINFYSYENGVMQNVTERYGTSSYYVTGGYSWVGETNWLLPDYSNENDYYCTLDFTESRVWEGSLRDYVVKAVDGGFSSWDAAIEKEDIKDQLLPADKTKVPYGYKANFAANNKEFTVFFKKIGHENDEVFNNDNVEILRLKIILENAVISTSSETLSDAPILRQEDPWFQIKGVKQEQGGRQLNNYIVKNGKYIYLTPSYRMNLDTLYSYGYQTVLINDKEVDLTQLYPVFYNDSIVRVFADHIEQESGLSVQDFSQGPVWYNAINDSGVRNYKVTFVKKEEGSKLFVNGAVSGSGERTVFLDNYFENKHDILIANVGEEELTGLKVTLDATNVRLDDYWMVGGEGNDTLAAFTTTYGSSYYGGQIPNIAKIRLLPDGEGNIQGTLTISADGQEDVVITLTGRAGNPKIITDSLDDAVKYVPYSYLVTTDNMYTWNKVTFSLVSGQLPAGLSLNSANGEIYGIPMETGTFPIRVRASYSATEFQSSYADLILEVKNNTNENVYTASDEGYEIIQTLGQETGNAYEYRLSSINQDQLFISSGGYGEFQNLWLNGQKLEKEVDYEADSGSTRITIKSQTFKNKANQTGTNTIAAEFRVDGDTDNDLKRTAQNFVINFPSSGSSSSGIGSGSSGNFVTDSDQSAADKVIAAIDALPVQVVLDNKTAIEEARTAYDSLTDSQKQLITNYTKLTTAERAITVLEKQQEADKKAAENLIKQIDELPSEISLKDKTSVRVIRKKYNLLTDNQKKLVTNLSLLDAAEETIEKLEKEEQKKVSGPQMYSNLKLYLGGDVTKSYSDSKYAKVWNKDGYSVTFTSDNTNVAKVGHTKGLVTAVGVGTATITAVFTDTNGKTITRTCKVTVKKNAVDAGVSEGTKKKLQALEVGKELQAIVFRTDIDNNTVWNGRDKITDGIRFTSSDENVFTVGATKGKITAVGVGEATLTVWAVQAEKAEYDEDGNIIYKATTKPKTYQVKVLVN